MKTVIVIVCFNPCDSFFDDNFNIANALYIIVDNTVIPQASFIARLANFKDVMYLPQYNNTGIAKALNIGCEKALELGYHYVITMDQDSKVTDEIITSLLNYYDKMKLQQNISIVSPTHLLQGDVIANVSYRSSNNSPLNSIFTMTSGNLVILSTWQQLGGFREDLFIDMVDIEFYIRAMLSGFMVLTLPNVVMQHNLGSLEVRKLFGKNISVLNHSPIRKYYQTRNILWLISNYYTRNKEVGKLFKVWLNIVIGVVLFEQNKLVKLKYIIWGIRDFIFGKLGKLDEQ